jgi:uncharacterized repeat protein (TIGR01451 family)
MQQVFRKLAAAISASLITALLGLQFIAAQPAVASAAAWAHNSTPAALSAGSPISPITGPPGFAMAEPIARTAPGSPASPQPAAPVNASYTHVPAPNPSNDLSPGNGPIMPTTTIYFDFWLPAGQHYESTAAGDTNYENLLIRFAKDIGSSQYHNIVTQYAGTNGTTGNPVTFGGSWVDTTTPYPHAGTTADPLKDSDIRTEVHHAAATNGWTEDINHIVAVFTATGIQECMGSLCTFSSNGFCAYHNHFSDGSNDAIYAFMSFDNFTHAAGKTCVAGQTSGDNDPNRSIYPNGDVSADAEVNTFSHELIEAETDPHPNATWTGPNGEIGDACNFNFAPRNDNGADVYLGGHPYIVQQEYSNAAHTCAIDLPTNGFCAGSVSNVCAPTTTYSKSVDVASPRVNSSVHYTLALHNTSDTAAETNLAVTDTVPAGYAVTGLSAPGSTSSSSTSGSITVSYDTLPVHQSRSIVVTATVPAQAGVTATNCGSLAGQDLLGTALPGQTTVPCAVTAPVKIPTIVTYTGALSGDFHDPATVSATLTDDSANPLPGKTIVFTLNGAETCSGTTDATGTASCQITPGEAAGPYSLTAAFTDTTDPVYAVSSTTATFTVTREETTTTYTGPTVILQGGSGVTLSGQLLEDGTSPIAGRTLTLGLGGQTCTGITDAAGDASCTLVFSGALGPQPLSAVFGGDAFYKPSSDTSQTAIVFAFPVRGAFALGDQTVAAATPATSVTWWGASWHKLNSLSGGGAPASFKGFAATVSLPASTPPMTCGSNWTTTPGNSPPPADGVPSYMGVLVVSHVAKSGSSISGDTVHIVVLKVAPGYQPDPGKRGTGTIVATYC